ncbi:DUF2764 family protein [Leptospira sp. GIMC2001]|uniref:DUF2764 family protein n=1 Tax=Leptospira sp. GIMC2001 TaxID=1513297 RepID=UPI002349C74E|nr:DUF2764 family protein [Leptospira sp. GIMC2001]WCL49068.1 DUF2764 family protein [Leptospira sp. GIMC2001]
MEYFYLVSSLPSVGSIDQFAESQINDIQNRILNELSIEDAENFKYLIYKNDNKNLLYVLRRKFKIKEDPLFTFHTPALFTYQELEEGILGLFELPNYMFEFLQLSKDEYNGSQTENLLIHLFYKEATSTQNGFLSDYFHFKRDLKNIISSINARKYGYDIDKYLLDGGRINETLRNVSSRDFGLGSGIYAFIEDLDRLLSEGKLTELEKFIDKIIIQFIDSYPWVNTFSADAVYMYFLKLSLSKRWSDLDASKGNEEMLRSLDWVIKSASIPSNYSMKSIT